jgi:hypothetical protein
MPLSALRPAYWHDPVIARLQVIATVLILVHCDDVTNGNANLKFVPKLLALLAANHRIVPVCLAIILLAIKATAGQLPLPSSTCSTTCPFVTVALATKTALNECIFNRMLVETVSDISVFAAGLFP